MAGEGEKSAGRGGAREKSTEQAGAKKRVDQLISDKIGSFRISMDLNQLCPAAPHMFWSFSRAGAGWGKASFFRGGACIPAQDTRLAVCKITEGQIRIGTEGGLH